MFTEDEIQCVNGCINETVREFIHFPNIFLTEDDLRVHLCAKLLQHFPQTIQTRDNDLSIALHSEVRWYGNANLNLRSDIVLVDVSTLNVIKYNKMPSKGFSFNFPNGIIELKLRRPVGKSNRQFSIDIKKDVKKLQKLREVFKHSEMHRRQTQFWMIVFDKKEDLQFDLSEADKEWLFFKYEFANQMRGTSLA